MWKKFVDIPLLVFLFFSIFYLVKNVFFNEKSKYTKIGEYRESIENLQCLLKKEKIQNERLKKVLNLIENNPQLVLKNFIRDYLWKVDKGESVILKKNRE